jgi:hypothetical protein
MKFLPGLLILLLFITEIHTFAATDTAGLLTVKFTTSQTTSPAYAPSHCVACWIVDSNGKFVKTLLAYAAERKQYLVAWKAATTSTYNTTDAVTGATKSSHAARTCTWNGKNSAGADVQDGTYTVKIECTDNNGNAQNLASFNIVKSTSSQSLTPTATRFTAISSVWTPNFTAVDQVTEESVKIYPDAEQKFLHIQGDGFIEANIYNILGKKLITTTEKKVSLQALPSSTYFVILKFKDGYVSRKFVKR